MFQITTQTAPCIRHLYVRHVQSTIEQQGDMTTQPTKTELTPAGLEMAKCLVNGLQTYMARPSCDPTGAKQCPVVYLNCFKGPCTDDSVSQKATYDFLAGEIAAMSGPARFDYGIVYSIHICNAADICYILSDKVGLTSVPLGLPLGSVTIVDEFPYNKFFIHAIGDLGLLQGYPLDKVNYWNNTP